MQGSDASTEAQTQAFSYGKYLNILCRGFPAHFLFSSLFPFSFHQSTISCLSFVLHFSLYHSPFSLSCSINFCCILAFAQATCTIVCLIYRQGNIVQRANISQLPSVLSVLPLFLLSSLPPSLHRDILPAFSLHLSVSS